MTLASPLRWTRLVGWAAVIALGTFSIVVLAWSRREPVSALWMVVATACVFLVSYRFHSVWLMAKVLTLDEMRAPPSTARADGKDFVRTHRWVVFGHHFAAIAGPGPLVGPVLAAQFGFLPGMLWILVGATLGGAVHDSVVLFCSVRRGGKSLAQMVKDEVGPFGGAVAFAGISGIMVIMLAVLGLVVVNALAVSPWGLSTIAATLPIAVIMGLVLKFRGHRPGTFPLVSIFGVAALLLSVWAGQFLAGSAWERIFTVTPVNLAWILMGYAVLAAIAPVWLILAPRDYLSTFMKIGTIGGLGVAVVVLAPKLQMPALTQFVHGGGPVFAGPVFPFCFITIACAAVSGFHAMIASGTTPKIIASERDIRVVGYGAMVTEMSVGILALIAACTMLPGEYFAINAAGAPAAAVAKVSALGFPVTAAQMSDLAASVGEKTMIGRAGGAPTFALGMAHLFAGVLHNPAVLGFGYHFAIMFEALFILTALDAGSRVGRFLVQDMLGVFSPALGRTHSWLGNIFATVAFVAAWGWFLYQGVVDPLGGINSLWPIFGIANQLMAVIALAFGTTVLIKMGRARYCWVTLAPLAWLFAVTMTAGAMKLFSPAPLGFLAIARELEAKLAAASPADAVQLRHLIFNNRVDAAVTALFVVLAFTCVAANARVWLRLATKQKAPQLREDPYIAVSAS
jgi:carbon starvation protein